MMLQFTLLQDSDIKKLVYIYFPEGIHGFCNPIIKIKMGVLHMIICSATDLFIRIIVMTELAASERGV
jgi:hypothetical protein